jgi:hypothetical protein
VLTQSKISRVAGPVLDKPGPGFAKSISSPSELTKGKPRDNCGPLSTHNPEVKLAGENEPKKPEDVI